MKRKLFPWLSVVLWAGVIFWLSAQTSPPDLGPQFAFKRKIEHMAGYAMLGLLLIRALRITHTQSLPKAAALTILIAAAYAASDEWHQSFVPNRHPQATDVLIDLVGCSIAVAVYCAYESRRRTTEARRTA
jgi:VanZ family protein